MAVAFRIPDRPPFEADMLHQKRGYPLDLVLALSYRVLWHLYRQEFGKYAPIGRAIHPSWSPLVGRRAPTALPTRAR